MRRSVIIVLVLLALVASMGCAATTVAPKAIAPKVRAPLIATVSTIANGEVAPTIVVTTTVVGGVESVFRPGLLASDLTVFPATGLTLGTVTYVSATQIAVAFTGAAEGGEVTIIANPSAFTPVAAAASNDMTVYISVPEVTAPVVKAKTWQTVIEFSGHSTKTTQKFTIDGDEWMLTWATKSNTVNGVAFPGNFSVEVLGNNGTFDQLAANAVGADNDTTHFYVGGEFYLEISGTQAYGIVISQYK